MQQFGLTDGPGPGVVAAFCAPTCNIDREFIEKCPDLRVIGSHSTGISHIDTEFCEKRGIAVEYVHPEDAEDITAVAEHTIGLIIALTRRYPQAFQAASLGQWERWPFAGEKMLSRMNLAIFGYGRIGRAVAAGAKAMGMKYLAFEANGEIANAYPFRESYGIPPPDLVDWDVMTLHTPPGIRTVTDKLLGHFRGYLINTARGESVDEKAVAAALNAGTLKGYAADVLDGEFEPDFDITQNPIWQAQRDGLNVILTPHIGGSTLDAWSETQAIAIDKVMAALS